MLHDLGLLLAHRNYNTIERKNSLKRIYSLIILSVVIMCFSGCNSNKDTIYGEDLVKYSTLYDTQSELSYEFPIICRTKIEDFAIEGYNITGDGDYVINYNGLTGGEKYKGWYYYFAAITVGINCDVPTEFEIESVDMNINGNRVNYILDKMYFTNVYGKYGKTYLTDTNAILYENGGPSHLVSKISDDLIYEVDFGVTENCIINDIGYFDFVEINNIEAEVNGESVTFDNNLSLKKGDYVRFKYNLSYKNGVSEKNLIKSTFYVKYKTNGINNIFVDEQGIIIVDLLNDNFIKNYIDQELVDK